MARETLTGIPPDDFLEIGYRLGVPIDMTEEDAARFADGGGKALYVFSRYLQWRTDKAGWEQEYSRAVFSGSTRLFLSLVDWLYPLQPTAAQMETRNWLKGPLPALLTTIETEVYGITEGDDDTATVTDSAEAEIQAYRAFVALGSSLETDLLEGGLTIQESELERLGAALAGLAIKRQLEGVEPESETKIISLDKAADLRRWFDS